MPQVSVIIPNYNHAPYLVQRIDSVLSQTFQDFEVIILDDCSPDNSREIIEQYRTHPKVVHIEYNTKNSGSTFRQWKKGIDLAQGEYIWIAESDDWASFEFLNQLLNSLTGNKEAVLAYCRSYNVTHQGSITGLNKWADALGTERWNTNYTNAGKQEIENYLLYRNIMPNASALVFKKNCFNHVDNELYLNLKSVGDWMVWTNILYQGSVEYIATPLNYYRSHAFTTRAGKSICSELSRVKEYFTVIDYIKITSNISKVDLSKHQWIIHEWVHNKRYLFRKHFWRYLYPPVSAKYLILIYIEFLKVIISKVFK